MSDSTVAALVGATVIAVSLEVYASLPSRLQVAFAAALGGLWGAVCWAVLG